MHFKLSPLLVIVWALLSRVAASIVREVQTPDFLARELQRTACTPRLNGLVCELDTVGGNTVRYTVNCPSQATGPEDCLVANAAVCYQYNDIPCIRSVLCSPSGPIASNCGNIFAATTGDTCSETNCNGDCVVLQETLLDYNAVAEPNNACRKLGFRSTVECPDPVTCIVTDEWWHVLSDGAEIETIATRNTEEIPYSTCQVTYQGNQCSCSVDCPAQIPPSIQYDCGAYTDDSCAALDCDGNCVNTAGPPVPLPVAAPVPQPVQAPTEVPPIAAPVAVPPTQPCVLSMRVYNTVDECQNTPGLTAATGTVIPDGTCRTAIAQTGNANLLPGLYRAECTADGRIRFLDSGCLDNGTCQNNSNDNCESDLNVPSYLFAALDPPEYTVNTPEEVFLSCTTVRSSSLSISFIVQGICSPDCSDMDIPVSPPMAAPVPAPLPITPPVSAPMTPPVTAPVVEPVPAPITSPVPAPVTPPVSAPVPAPVTPQMSAPVDVPVTAPVSTPTVTSGTLVDLVVADPDLQTLEDAVIAAGLVEALSGLGPFTLLGPINSAFVPSDALNPPIDQAYLETLLTPPYILHLQNLLAFHVIGGQNLSTDLSDGLVLTMLNEEEIIVRVTENGVFFTSPFTDAAQVLEADIVASNGVLHKIDGSILYPSFVGRNLLELLSSSPDYSTLVSLLQMTGLDDAVSTGELTILAPNNDAFEAVPQEVVDALLADVDALTAVLLYHVIEGVFPSVNLTPGQTVVTLNGASVEVGVDGESGVTINSVPVVLPDGLARNGIAHGIGSVLIPETQVPTGPVTPSPVAVPSAPVSVPVVLPPVVNTIAPVISPISSNEQCGLWSFQTNGNRYSFWN